LPFYYPPLLVVVGSNGQISLGKEFAGKMVLIDQVDDGTWIIKSGEFVPDSKSALLDICYLPKHYRYHRK